MILTAKPARGVKVRKLMRYSVMQGIIHVMLEIGRADLDSAVLTVSKVRSSGSISAVNEQQLHCHIMAIIWPQTNSSIHALIQLSLHSCLTFSNNSRLLGSFLRILLSCYILVSLAFKELGFLFDSVSFDALVTACSSHTIWVDKDMQVLAGTSECRIYQLTRERNLVGMVDYKIHALPFRALRFMHS